MKTFFQNPHLQTLYATFYPKPKINTHYQQRFTLSDGDFVDCVWYEKPYAEDTRPIVILFHGLAGSVSSPYILRTMQDLHRRGYRVVLMHFRGCSGVPNLLPRSYHSGDTQDAKEWIGYLRQHYPSVPLFAIGFSLGGNMLLKLMGEFSEEQLLQGAVAVSAPMDLALCADRINQGFSKLYQRHLLSPLLAQLLQKYESFEMEKFLGIKVDEVKKLKTFWEFDDAYTAPIHGFKDAKEYYEKSSAKQYLCDIKAPTLILHAKDDPFTGEGVIPSKDEMSQAVSLEVSEYGGHIGFVGGTFSKPEFWLYERMGSYLDTLSKVPSLVK